MAPANCTNAAGVDPRRLGRDLAPLQQRNPAAIAGQEIRSRRSGYSAAYYNYFRLRHTTVTSRGTLYVPRVMVFNIPRSQKALVRERLSWLELRRIPDPGLR